MTKIKITQVKSGIDRPERQKLTLRALGLNKMNASREVEASDQILGMVRKVNHLIKIEEVAGGNEVVETNSEATAAPIAATAAPVEANAAPVETAVPASEDSTPGNESEEAAAV